MQKSIFYQQFTVIYGVHYNNNFFNIKYNALNCQEMHHSH